MTHSIVKGSNGQRNTLKNVPVDSVYLPADPGEDSVYVISVTSGAAINVISDGKGSADAVIATEGATCTFTNSTKTWGIVVA